MNSEYSDSLSTAAWNKIFFDSRLSAEFTRTQMNESLFYPMYALLSDLYAANKIPITFPKSILSLGSGDLICEKLLVKQLHIDWGLQPEIHAVDINSKILSQKLSEIPIVWHDLDMFDYLEQDSLRAKFDMIFCTNCSFLFGPETPERQFLSHERYEQNRQIMRVIIPKILSNSGVLVTQLLDIRNTIGIYDHTDLQHQTIYACAVDESDNLIILPAHIFCRFSE